MIFHILKKNILNNLIDILQIEFNNNKKLILYYDISNPLIGFIDNKKYYNQIITNRYLKLDNNKYFIFNYDIDNVILHWTGYINDKHYITYAGLRLFRLNNKLFNKIYNDVKLLTDEEFKNKYSKISDVLLNRSIQSIYECTKRNINFNNEFNNLVKYINDNKQQRKILYRGDRRYKKTDFSNNIIEYKNVHPFADNKEEAFKFMTNYYFGYDENIKEYNFFILLNGYTARIRAFLLDNLMGRNKNFLPIYRINNDWIEYLHNPVKYKIIDFKKETINYKYQNGLEKEINYNLIVIKEII